MIKILLRKKKDEIQKASVIICIASFFLSRLHISLMVIAYNGSSSVSVSNVSGRILN